ncbi:MAG: hypothetical protein WA782_10725 [Sulfitobacter sp.]
MTIEIPTGEIGTTRVFSLSMPSAHAKALQASIEAQIAILGAEVPNPEGVEVFPVSDLGEIGLVGYLREGTDAREADLNRDAAKLAALDGWVMLVHSLAFAGEATTLTPDLALTLIGTYAQPSAPSAHIDLTAQAANPYTGASRPAAKTMPPHRSGSLVVGALVALAVLVLWWAFT